LENNTVTEEKSTIDSSDNSTSSREKSIITVERIIIIILAILIIFLIAYKPKIKPSKTTLGTFADSLSYSFGYIYGSQLLDVDFELNYDKFIKGLVNTQNPSIKLMTDDQMDSVLNRFFAGLQTRRTMETEEIRYRNQTEGQQYMAQNALDPAVKTAPAGIQYKVLKAGNGRKATVNDVVTAHYTGRFISGEEFQTTRDIDEPMTFKISEVLDGWREGLVLMREGDIFEIVIPDSLAYGEMGYDIIEPGAYLIFEVELIKVN